LEYWLKGRFPFLHSIRMRLTGKTSFKKILRYINVASFFTLSWLEIEKKTCMKSVMTMTSLKLIQTMSSTCLLPTTVTRPLFAKR
jgi:hypothetical protein